MMGRYLASVIALLITPACGEDPGSDAASSEGANGSGASANRSGGIGGATAASNGSGAGGATSSTASGAGGGVPACVTDIVLLAEAGQSRECAFSLPAEYLDSDINLVIELQASPQVICWRASSQGCDIGGFPGGWWYSGDQVALCDSTCTTVVETEGAKLYLWVGCPNDTCL
jgi:hypothetical protein